MTTALEVVKVALPLAATANAQKVITTCQNQASIIQQCPAYATTPTVQAAVTDMNTAVTNLQTTEGKIETLVAELGGLRTTRTQQIGIVRIKHENVESAINTASNGDPVAAQAWVGKTKERAKPAAITQNTAPPTGASLRAVKRHNGTVKGRCNPEPSAEGYLFQTGSDPLNPQNWPAPAFSKGHTFTLANQTIGQTVNMRIAIVRRGSVQSQWTQVLQVVVT
jgi:hypothetical protein